MGEGLREVSKMFACRTELLRIEPDMVRIAKHLFEKKPCLLDVAGTGETFDVPEAAHVERAFDSSQPIERCLTGIAVDEAVIPQPITDCFQRGEPARVRGADTTHERHQQAGCIQCCASLALHERALLWVPESPMDLLIDCIASLEPIH